MKFLTTINAFHPNFAMQNPLLKKLNFFASFNADDQRKTYVFNVSKYPNPYKMVHQFVQWCQHELFLHMFSTMYPNHSSFSDNYLLSRITPKVPAGTQIGECMCGMCLLLPTQLYLLVANRHPQD